MNSHTTNKLLGDVLTTEGLEHLRKQSLTRMLRVAHRRQLMRRAGTLAVMSLALIAAVWLLSPEETKQAGTSVATPAVIKASGNTTRPVIVQISDAELLALFPRQTVALVGPPGKQELLLFEPEPGRVY